MRAASFRRHFGLRVICSIASKNRRPVGFCHRRFTPRFHSSARNIPFRPPVVEQLHRDLYSFTSVPAGRWKNVDNAITFYLENEGWYDDISDGPVTAHVKLTATGDEFDAAGAWVLVAPPDYAPAQK